MKQLQPYYVVFLCLVFIFNFNLNVTVLKVVEKYRPKIDAPLSSFCLRVYVALEPSRTTPSPPFPPFPYNIRAYKGGRMCVCICVCEVTLRVIKKDESDNNAKKMCVNARANIEINVN